MKKKYTLWGNLLFLLQGMKSHTPQSLKLIPVCILAKVLLPIIGIWLPNIVVEAIINQSDPVVLVLKVTALAGVMILASFLEQWSMGLMEAESGQLCQGIENQLFCKKMNCDYENLENKEISGRYAEASSNMWNRRRYIRTTANNLVMTGAGIFGFLIYLALLRRLPVWLLLLMATATLISFLFSDMGQKYRMKRQNFLGDGVRRISYLQKVSAGPKAGKDIRMYGMIHWMEAKFSQFHKEIRRDYIAIEKKNFLSGLLTAGMGIIMEGSAYLYLLKMAVQREITVADYVLYIGAVLGFTGWVRQIAEQMQKLWLMKGDVDAVRECLDMPDRSSILREGRDAVPVEKYRQTPCEIIFDHVSYRYPGTEADTIKDLSFHIKKGERIALVGMNGAGKTTCVKLLCGLLEPTEGRILINGVASTDFRRDEYYSLFSTVFQEINLLPFSIRENITGVNKGEEDEAWLEQCLGFADLKERIDALPQKLDTLLVKELNAQAVSFSGGELQRLLLARALYKNAPVLILDEPTAALDPVSESNVYQRYFTLTQNNTSIFISHRLASTRFCDRIFFMENGSITETGSHGQLIALGGKYTDVFEVQSRYYRKKPDEVEVTFS